MIFLGFQAEFESILYSLSRSFLTKDTNNIGGDETFYMHCLNFYIPMIAEVTLES